MSRGERVGEFPDTRSCQPSAFSLQPSAFSLQPSAFSLQLSVFSQQPEFCVGPRPLAPGPCQFKIPISSAYRTSATRLSTSSFVMSRALYVSTVFTLM